MAIAASAVAGAGGHDRAGLFDTGHQPEKAYHAVVAF